MLNDQSFPKFESLLRVVSCRLLQPTLFSLLGASNGHEQSNCDKWNGGLTEPADTISDYADTKCKKPGYHYEAV